MKRFVAFFLLTQILTTNTFVVEFLRLPSLFQHYVEHCSETQTDLSFADYLSAHYLKGDHLKKDHCDEKLPFKHCQDCCSHQMAQTFYLIPENKLVALSPDPIMPICGTSEQPFYSSYSGSIFQPPKFS
ncbi:MAG: hypothetical protein ACYC1Q_13435 [Bacteroidia bacterium]